MSELLDPEDDTLIWSAWVFLREHSLVVRNLHAHRQKNWGLIQLCLDLSNTYAKLEVDWMNI